MFQDSFYQLKRLYGKQILLYRALEVNNFIESGLTTINYREILIKKAIVLPNKFNFQQFQRNNIGGFNNVNRQKIFIDNRDLPTDFIPKPGDVVELDSRQIQVIDVYFDQNGYMLYLSGAINQDRINRHFSIHEELLLSTQLDGELT